MQPSTTDKNPQAAAGLNLPTTWQDAWNRHDAEGLAALVAPDVEFVTVAGLWLRGWQEFLAHHRRLHETQMRLSTWTTAASTVRLLGKGHALAHVEWRIEGDFDTDGGHRSPRRGIFTWVLQLRDAPLILAGHNTNLASNLAHRLTGGT